MVTYQDVIEELSAAEMKVDLVREMYTEKLFSDYYNGTINKNLRVSDLQDIGDNLVEMSESIKNILRFY